MIRKEQFHKLLKSSFRIIFFIVLFVICYLHTAISFSYIPANSGFTQCEKDAIEIYIMTNGVHTDLVLPIKNECRDWSKFVNPADTKSGSMKAKFVAFGWGDKGFFLETPTWGDLKFKTAFNALFYLGKSAMHVTFYERLIENKSCQKINISKESYIKLVNYINESFDPDNSGNAKQIKGASYWKNDSFYEAKGAYSLFYTCNTWANCGLKAADLKACLWTPFDKGIFYQYK